MAFRQAFWLTDQSNYRTFPVVPVVYAAFVPEYSNDWLTMDSNHLSF